MRSRCASAPKMKASAKADDDGGDQRRIVRHRGGSPPCVDAKRMVGLGEGAGRTQPLSTMEAKIAPVTPDRSPVWSLLQALAGGGINGVNVGDGLSPDRHSTAGQ